MRRRLIRMTLFMVVLPLVIRFAEAVADHLEATRGPSAPSTLLRRGSKVGRWIARR
jgi:hypothetical protein